MKTHPMLFSGPMIRALLDGHKTQTRRILKPQPDSRVNGFQKVFAEAPYFEALIDDQPFPAAFPYPKYCASPFPKLNISVGDLIWARETWNAFSFSQDGDEAWPTETIPTSEDMQTIRDMAYRVDVQAVYQESDRARKWFADQKWRPGIHMPRWASRITLEVTDVRVQRLQDIDEKDSLSEGIGWIVTQPFGSVPQQPKTEFEGVSGRLRESAVLAFGDLWNSINGPDAWGQNPWVVAYSFNVHKKNVDELALG